MNPDIQPVLAQLERIVLGKSAQLKLAVTCLLSRGHLLLEDVPGVGKTTLALALARVMGLEFQRMQFTSDLLPADILGVSMFEPASASFRFHPGPVFSQVLLADEINRASPKTQSALLEAMEERQVTQDGVSRPLPDPFFVIATQNPLQQIGVFPLPESQLDRFLMRLSLGYPPRQAEAALLLEPERRDLLAELKPAASAEKLLAWQQAVRKVVTAPALVNYLMALIDRTRHHEAILHGLSPRAGLALRRAAQAWAFIEGRSAVLPEDVQAVFSAVVEHRLTLRPDRSGTLIDGPTLLREVAIP